MVSPRREIPAPAEALRHAEALFFVEDLEDPVIGAEDMHHLLAVLRPKVGQHLVLGDGRGSWREAVITALPRPQRRSREVASDAGGLTLDLHEVNTDDGEGSVELTVAFAMPKGDRLDLVVQKLCELGIDRIAPLITRRTVVRLDDDDRHRRQVRCARVAREACSQSRRLNLPDILEPMTLGQFLSGAPDQTVFAEPGGGALDAGVRCVIIGPEGGFDHDEIPPHARFVGLGPNILRAETAAIAAGTLLSALRSGFVGSD